MWLCSVPPVNEHMLKWMNEGMKELMGWRVAPSAAWRAPPPPSLDQYGAVLIMPSCWLTSGAGMPNPPPSTSSTPLTGAAACQRADACFNLAALCGWPNDKFKGPALSKIHFCRCFPTAVSERHPKLKIKVLSQKTFAPPFRKCLIKHAKISALCDVIKRTDSPC